MPIVAHIEGDLLRIDLTGVITRQDLLEVTAFVHAMEQKCPRTPHRLTDLSATMGLAIGFSEMEQLAAARKARKFPNAFKSAIVAPRPVHVGFARMFQMLNDHPQIAIQVFSDLEAAKAWLAAPATPAHS